MTKVGKVTLPTIKRKYFKVYAPTAGLRYDTQSTLLKEEESPRCSEVVFRDGKVSKAKGTQYFANTDSYPLQGSVMYLVQYKRSDDVERLLAFTTTAMYVYNSSLNRFDMLWTKNLMCRVTVRVKSSKSLTCRTTVV